VTTFSRHQNNRRRTAPGADRGGLTALGFAAKIRAFGVGSMASAGSPQARSQPPHGLHCEARATMRKILFFLGQMNDSDVEWIIRHGRRQQVPAGEVLIHEGQPIDSVFILLEGVLIVSGSSLGANTVRLCSGEVVGEMSLLDSRPPSATVTAEENSIVLALPRDKLLDSLKDNADFAARFYRSLAMFLCHRMRNLYQQLGYGKGQPLEEDRQYDDELSPELLDSVHLAASRFDRALQRILAS
jgi:CRP/FNR family transcriptional regulator, cyclic AMP receptor protein